MKWQDIYIKYKEVAAKAKKQQKNYNRQNNNKNTCTGI